LANGTPTAFQYIPVEKVDLGLTEAELFFADDKLLNQMISIKKLFPYKEGAIGEKERKKMAKMRALVRQSAEENQKKFKKEMELLEKEKEVKANSKKGKKYQEEYEEFMRKKEEKIKKIYSKKSNLDFM
jgi:protein KRI1